MNQFERLPNDSKSFDMKHHKMDNNQHFLSLNMD